MGNRELCDDTHQSREMSTLDPHSPPRFVTFISVENDACMMSRLPRHESKTKKKRDTSSSGLVFVSFQHAK
jgi:hypothetical protein